MIAVEQQFRSHVRGYLARIPERVRPSEWLKRLKLPAGFHETQPGPVRLCRWMEEPLDCLALRNLPEILLSAPTQEGKTFLLRMVMICKIGWRPGPGIWLDSTVPKGRSFIKKYLRPLVDTEPALAAHKPSNPHHYTNSEMLFDGGAWNVYGANSEKQVAGDTVEVICGNEAAKWGKATDEEAAILELVRHRTEQFPETRKHYFSSTPTTEGNLFWIEIEKGDKRVWCAVCRDCGHAQALEWGDQHSPFGVKWDLSARQSDGTWDLRRVLESAYYLCANPGCGSHWNDRMRIDCIEHPAAFWQPTKTAEPDYRSYVLTGLYGRKQTHFLGPLAASFLSARRTGFLIDRQDFWNSRMGAVWRQEVGQVNVKKLQHLEREYLRGETPADWKPDLAIMGVDVQRDRFRFVVRAFSWQTESYLIDFGWIATWSDLDEVEKDYRPIGGKWFTIVDLNFEDRRQEVREAVFERRHRGWLVADGIEWSAERVKVERENVFLGGKGGGAKHYIPRLVISTYDFKLEIEARFTGKIKNWFLPRLDPAAPKPGESLALRFPIRPEEVEEYAEYKKELLDEQRVKRARPKRGMPEDEFRARSKKNHALDCEVYILALFWSLVKRRSARARRGSAATRGKPVRRTMEVARE